jgi:SET domain-containing protein
MPPSLLYGFAFHWPDPPYVEAMVLGAVSLVNHADDPNAWFEPSIEEQVLRLWAGRDIAAGEEITIAYGIPLWFEPVT